MQVLGTLTVVCKCGKKHPFDAEEADFYEVSSVNHDNSVKTTYKWDIDFNCSRCGKGIIIDYDVVEFPKGNLGNQKVKVKNAELTEKYEFKF